MQHVIVSYIIPMARFHAPARHSSRLGQRFQVALGAAAALAAISLSPGSAQAYVVTVGGVQYDVTTFTGSYNANTSKFATPANGGVMPWWGNSTLANSFAQEVFGGLATPNGGTGPLFAYTKSNASGGYWDAWAYVVDGMSGLPFPNPLPISSDLSTSFVWAQATLYTAPSAPAPGPLPLLGAGAALGFSRKLRNRIKLAPNALGSALPQA
jgi:hypothetical protein